MSEEEKKILLQKYNEEGEGEGEEEEEEEGEEEEGEEEGEEKEREGAEEMEIGEEGEGEGEGEGEKEGKRDNDNDNDDNDHINGGVNNIIWESKMMTENENISLKKLKENNSKILKTVNTEMSNNENSKNYSVKYTDLRRCEISQTNSINDSQKRDVTVSEQIPLQRQYGNKKKFVINSPEKAEGTGIGENQHTGKSVYYLINDLITSYSFLFLLFLNMIFF